MRSSLLRRSLAGGALALALSTPALASPGTVALSWNSCGTNPLSDLAVAPGQATGVNLTAWLTGQSDPTQAYQVKVIYGNPQKAVPDAWRFDPSGCQTNLYVTLNHLPPAGALAKTCPAFQNAGMANTSVQIKDLNFASPTSGYPTSMMLIQVAVAYPNGNVPLAGNKYFLMDAEFDQTFGADGPSVPPNCGGLEQPMCFTLVAASYILNDGTLTEIPFSLAGTPLSANAPGGGCVSAVPAHPATWGGIKAQYRN